MALKILAATATRATTLATLLAAVAVGAMSLSTDASAAPKKKYRATNGPVRTYSGPVDYSYMAGPRTRVFITRRSWLDAGTEVQPGERKFTDYAIPPNYSYTRQIDRNYYGRHPLSESGDLGGYPTAFPLY